MRLLVVMVATLACCPASARSRKSKSKKDKPSPWELQRRALLDDLAVVNGTAPRGPYTVAGGGPRTMAGDVEHVLPNCAHRDAKGQ